MSGILMDLNGDIVICGDFMMVIIHCGVVRKMMVMLLLKSLMISI